jgi:2-oxo-3-hexenedioate decarboxylase
MMTALADEIAAAYADRRSILTPPSARPGGLTLDQAYAVESELARRRQAAGHAPIGRKVGFASKALWRVLGLQTVVWANMYDDTVRFAEAPGNNDATLSIARMVSPKIEPEIVLKLKTPPAAGVAEASQALAAVEWIALGYEIIDCVFPDWKFHPADFVAAYGLHAALVVGTPLRIGDDSISALAEALPRFTVKLLKDGALVDEGGGKNVLRSPALCLAELASAVPRQSGARPLAAGELISTGTLTTSQFISPGQTWAAVVDGLDLPALTLRVTP